MTSGAYTLTLSSSYGNFSHIAPSGSLFGPRINRHWDWMRLLTTHYEGFSCMLSPNNGGALQSEAEQLPYQTLMQPVRMLSMVQL